MSQSRHTESSGLFGRGAVTRAPDGHGGASRKAPPAPRNGIDVATRRSTASAFRRREELALFRFRARNRWQRGAQSQTRIESFHGLGGEHSHVRDFAQSADLHPVLGGDDEAPAPLETFLHALLSSLTTTVAMLAAMRCINLTALEARIEGDIDLRGWIALEETVSPGYQNLRIAFRICGGAPEEELTALIESARKFCPIANSVCADVDVVVDAVSPV